MIHSYSAFLCTVWMHILFHNLLQTGLILVINSNISTNKHDLAVSQMFFCRLYNAGSSFELLNFSSSWLYFTSEKDIVGWRYSYNKVAALPVEKLQYYNFFALSNCIIFKMLEKFSLYFLVVFKTIYNCF